MNQFDQNRLNEYVRERMEKSKLPGLSITFSAPGVHYEQAFGRMDETGTPVTPDTIMGIASLSKSMTGVCCALLESQGKLSFSDPVTRFFPRFKIPGTPKDSVLISHLLTHTAGLPPLPTLLHCIAAHAVKDEGEKWDTDGLDSLIKVESAEDIIDYIAAGEYESLGQPGEYMSYSNDGYAILSAIIDKAAGMPMEQYIERELFSPLGMTRSALGFDRLKDFDNVTRLFSKDDDKITASDNWDEAPPYRGCGWIISTSRDLHRYYKALSQDGMQDGARVLPEAVCRRMLGGDFPELSEGVYGYGLNKVKCGNQLLFTHTGGLKGVSSAGAFFKGSGVAGAILSNMSDVDALRILMGAFNILRGIEPDTVVHNFKLSQTPPQEPWIFEGFFGGRESGLPIYSKPHKVARSGGKLMLHLPRESEPRELHFCGGTRFFAAKAGEDPLREGMSVRFFVRGDKAWAVQAGSRMLQRI